MILNHPHRNSSNLLSFPIYSGHFFIKFKVISSLSMPHKAEKPKGNPEHSIPFDLGQVEGVPLAGTLYCPFSSGINPNYETAREHIKTWVLEKNLLKADSKEYQKFIKADFARLCAFTYRSETADQLKLVSEFVAWLFCHDDFRDDPNSPLCNDPEKIKAMNDVLKLVLKYGITPSVDTQVIKEFPLIAALCKSMLEILNQLILISKNNDISDFIESLDQYFQANIWEAENRKSGTVPTVLDYENWRYFTSAVIPTYEIGFILRDISISKEDRKSPGFLTAIKKSCNSICFTNDIFSLKKEKKDGVHENIVVVYENQDQLTLPSALVKAIVTQDNEVWQFQQHCLHFKEKYPNAIELIESWIRGNLDWSLGTVRYK